jgi:PAS domain S-box-containing protein
VVGIGREGRVLLFNAAAERASGLLRDQIIGEPFVATLFPEPRHAEAIEEVVLGKKSAVDLEDAPMRTRAGKLRLVRWRIAHAAAANEDVVAFAIGRDVTDETAIAERARQVEKLAAVGTLAAGLAHEIRNPLNGAHLHVTFLERGLRRTQADPDTLDAVRIVGDEIQRLSRLVTEFLDFARPKPLTRAPVSIQALAARVAQLVHKPIVLDLPNDPLVVDVDGARIEQVLLNLVQNAVDAIAVSGHRVVLRARRQPISALVEVEDDGPGLTDPHAPIFDAFYSTKPEGTGLGLAIAYRIVSDHGGTLTVESSPGRTVFRFTLPLEGTN